MNYKIFYLTKKRGVEIDKENEDHCLFIEYQFMNDERIRILVVSDGMGGLANAEKTAVDAVEGFSMYIYQNIQREYIKNYGEKNFSLENYADRTVKIVREAIKAANDNVCDKAEIYADVGATLSAVVIVGRYAVIANIGDSPIYYYSAEEDELNMVSKLQTRAEANVEKGVYARYSDEYYRDDYLICHFLGETESLEDKSVFVKVLSCRKGDMFLVGSDGAFGRMRENEILNIIQNTNETKILKTMFERAREDGDDDQTALLYKICDSKEVEQ